MGLPSNPEGAALWGLHFTKEKDAFGDADLVGGPAMVIKKGGHNTWAK